MRPHMTSKQPKEDANASWAVEAALRIMDKGQEPNYMKLRKNDYPGIPLLSPHHIRAISSHSHGLSGRSPVAVLMFPSPVAKFFAFLEQGYWKHNIESDSSVVSGSRVVLISWIASRRQLRFIT
jgi:hypothetical protein